MKRESGADITISAHRETSSDKNRLKMKNGSYLSKLRLGFRYLSSVLKERSLRALMKERSL